MVEVTEVVLDQSAVGLEAGSLLEFLLDLLKSVFAASLAQLVSFACLSSTSIVQDGQARVVVMSS